MPSDSPVPEEGYVVQLGTNQIGLVGEILFTGKHSIPDPVKEAIRPIIESESPDWVPFESLHIQSRHNPTGGELFEIEYEGESWSWEPDAFIKAHLSSRNDRFEWDKETTLLADWRMRLPVEVKTGPNASFHSGQERAIKLLASEEDLHPIVVWLDVSDFPESYTVTDVSIVTTDW